MRSTIVSTFLMLVAFLAPLPAAELKIALIDMQESFKQYYKTDEAQERLKQDMSGYQKSMEDKREDYRKLVEQIKSLQEGAKDPSASDASKKEKEQKLKEKVTEAQTRENEMNQFAQQTSKMFQDSQQRMRKTIVDEINKEIETFAKGKYNLILDKSGMTLNGTPALVYSEGMTDVTAEVIKILNKSKPAGEAKKTP
jgi:outer membrane protein